MEGKTKKQDGEDMVAKSVKPALEKLRQDQIELIDKFNRGFDSRREIVEWIPHLSLCTLGVLKNSILRQLVFGRHRLKVFLGDSRQARFHRRNLLDGYIQQSWNMSFEALRDKSKEYVQEVDNIDEIPESNTQKYAAMRPYLTELKNKQEKTIKQLLNGFNDRHEFTVWCNKLNHASNGYISRQFGSDLIFQRSIKKHLFKNTDKPRKSLFHRVNLCATHIVPPYNTAIRYTAKETGEFDEAIENTLPGGQI